MNRKFKGLISALLTVLLMLQPGIALAETVNYEYTVEASMDTPSSQIQAAQYITADTAHRPGYVITEVQVSWELKAGDTVELQFWDGDATQLQTMIMNTGTLSVRNRSITPPTGAATGLIVLNSSSTTGWRYSWIKQFTNNYDSTAVFLDPTIEQDPPEDPEDPEDPPPSGGTDLSGVIAGMGEIKGAINGMSSGVITELQSIGGQLTDVKNQLGTIASDMNQQFNSVKDRLDDISSDTSAMRSYFTTPRTPSPLQVPALPTPSMDTTVPDLTEPYQTPYTFNRSEPNNPVPNYGPEPLPYAPDPEVMPHDAPLLAQEVALLDEPVPRQNPRNRDPVTKQEPRPLDPVAMETPRQRDAVSMDLPLTRDNPIGRQNPLSAETPLTPQSPLTPTPPLTPGG